MLDRILASARPQFRTFAHLAHRDLPLQIGSFAMLCALCLAVGYVGITIAVFSAVVASEFCVYLILRRRGLFRTIDSDHAALLALFLCSLNVVLYLVPALYLAQDPSLAMKITGMMWIMGVQVYMSNTWLRVPVFLTAMLVPAMVMMAIAFFLLQHGQPVSSSLGEWLVGMVFLVLFLYSSIDTLRHHLTTEAEIHKANRVSDQRLAQLEESHRLDALTGLLNRRAFDVALDVMLQDRKMTEGQITVFLVDLDSFKPINDTYSHEAGDEVLVQTAQRLATMVGQSGIVGRMGGDEFICAIHDLETDDSILAYGDGLAKVISRPTHWNARTLKIAASIGAATTSKGDLESVSALCSAADQAMFAAKSSPNSDIVLYEAHLFAPRMTPEDKQRLIQGISDRSLRPYFQAKVHLPTGNIIGFEALARWERQDGDVRGPSEFIDQINDLGLQGDFMMSLAQQVVEAINHMLEAGLDPGQVSLNVSEVALATHSGRQELQKIVADNPAAAKHLTFEITEDVFIARAAETIQASIASFRALGVRISLDDFGTGFASFHHLRQLEFDELKIDTSFVAGLGHDPTAEVLVRGFLSIASGLGVNVIAEGVETDAQGRDLMNMGCMSAQGFLFSEAVDLAKACTQLDDQQKASHAL